MSKTEYALHLEDQLNEAIDQDRDLLAYELRSRLESIGYSQDDDGHWFTEDEAQHAV